MKLCQSTKLKVSVPVSSPIHRQRSPMPNSKPKTFKYQRSKGPREQDFLVQTSILKQHRLCSMPTQENFLQISKRVSSERLDERNTWFDRSESHRQQLATSMRRNKGVLGLADMAKQARPILNRPVSNRVSPSRITDSYNKPDPKHNIGKGRA